MRHAAFRSTNQSVQVRYYLNLTQEELSLYLGIARTRVADAENTTTASRRALPTGAWARLHYLFLLLPPGAAALFATTPPPPPVGVPVGVAVPVAGPAALTAAERRRLELDASIAQKQAFLLRHTLEQRLAQAAYLMQVHGHHQAVAAAFANPPAEALALRQTFPDEDPEYTAFLRDRLTRRAARPPRLGPDLAPLALARAGLRLSFLETEAATLAAWLAAAGEADEAT